MLQFFLAPGGSEGTAHQDDLLFFVQLDHEVRVLPHVIAWLAACEQGGS